MSRTPRVPAALSPPASLTLPFISVSRHVYAGAVRVCVGVPPYPAAAQSPAPPPRSTLPRLALPGDTFVPHRTGVLFRLRGRFPVFLMMIIIIILMVLLNMSPEPDAPLRSAPRALSGAGPGLCGARDGEEGGNAPMPPQHAAIWANIRCFLPDALCGPQHRSPSRLLQ